MREARIFKHELKACIRKYLDTLDAAEAAKAIIDMNLAPDQVSNGMKATVRVHFVCPLICEVSYWSFGFAAHLYAALAALALSVPKDSEVVRKAYIFSMERSKDPEQAAKAVVGLLEQLRALGELDQECIIQGLAQIKDLLPDVRHCSFPVVTNGPATP